MSLKNQPLDLTMVGISGDALCVMKWSPIVVVVVVVVLVLVVGAVVVGAVVAAAAAVVVVHSYVLLTLHWPLLVYPSRFHFFIFSGGGMK